MNRRRALICLCGIGLAGLSCGVRAKTTLSSIPMKQHEAAMRAAIGMGAQNASYPFGAVITNASNGSILAKGVNQTFQNPVLHGEMVCINNYVSQQGNKNWGDCVLYTTGEPCPMCMSALVWAGIGGVVYGSSAESIKKTGIDIFTFSAKDINQGNSFSQTQLLGGILESECNALFIHRKR
ncbi:nucleoside deaminase [Polynucleobacter sp. AP-Titi-500A-B4]|uniref:nucleoside deaminase n=1 Tax=Polynucleobacter sp. AP-Titi-500A-B4 TaxID=2576923 RepID=UPI001BFD1D76|nr:nucleoside deaminase [Polynucleobacter sp. AP-Titi-500A-B4]QWE12183.1 nucleoside deaminase [Polynucleobacter sp. AP-Titi-500A-B4]